MVIKLHVLRWVSTSGDVNVAARVMSVPIFTPTPLRFIDMLLPKKVQIGPSCNVVRRKQWLGWISPPSSGNWCQLLLVSCVTRVLFCTVSAMKTSYLRERTQVCKPWGSLPLCRLLSGARHILIWPFYGPNSQKICCSSVIKIYLGNYCSDLDEIKY